MRDPDCRISGTRCLRSIIPSTRPASGGHPPGARAGGPIEVDQADAHLDPFWNSAGMIEPHANCPVRGRRRRITGPDPAWGPRPVQDPLRQPDYELAARVRNRLRAGRLSVGLEVHAYRPSCENDDHDQ